MALGSVGLKHERKQKQKQKQKQKRNRRHKTNNEQAVQQPAAAG
jgi:hypothetical protein